MSRVRIPLSPFLSGFRKIHIVSKALLPLRLAEIVSIRNVHSISGSFGIVRDISRDISNYMKGYFYGVITCLIRV